MRVEFCSEGALTCGWATNVCGSLHAPEERRVVFRRQFRLAGDPARTDPGRSASIRRSNSARSASGQRADLGIGETSHDEVHFTHAPVPGAIEDLLAADVEIGAAACRSAHDRAPGEDGVALRRHCGYITAHAHLATRFQTQSFPFECPCAPPFSIRFSLRPIRCPGVGPKIAPLLDRLLGEPGRPARVADLLFHLPTSGIARELKGSIADAPVGEPVTLAVTVTAHRPPPPGRRGALQGTGRGRYRRRDAGVFQRPQGPSGKAAAPRGAPLCVGQDRDVGRNAPDGASGPGSRRARPRDLAGCRGDLRPDRRALLPHGRALHERRAREGAGPARMAGSRPG